MPAYRIDDNFLKKMVKVMNADRLLSSLRRSPANMQSTLTLGLMTRAPRETRLLQVAIDVLAAATGVAAALAVGKELISAPAFKLLNIAGLSFDLIGVCLVTLVVLLPSRIRDPIVAWGGVLAVSLTGFLSLGFYVGLAVSVEVLGGKDHGLFGHFAPVVLFGMASAFLLEDTVMLPKFKRLISAELVTVHGRLLHHRRFNHSAIRGLLRSMDVVHTRPNMSTRYGPGTTPPRACYLYVKGRFLGPATSALGPRLCKNV